MQAAGAPRRAPDRTLFVSSGLAEHRYVIRRYLTQADDDIVPIDSDETQAALGAVGVHTGTPTKTIGSSGLVSNRIAYRVHHLDELARASRRSRRRRRPRTTTPGPTACATARPAPPAGCPAGSTGARGASRPLCPARRRPGPVGATVRSPPAD